MEFKQLLFQMSCNFDKWPLPIYGFWEHRQLDWKRIFPCTVLEPVPQAWCNLWLGYIGFGFFGFCKSNTGDFSQYIVKLPKKMCPGITCLGPLFGLIGFHAEMIRFCWTHNWHLGLYHRSNGSAMLFGDASIYIYIHIFVECIECCLILLSDGQFNVLA